MLTRISGTSYYAAYSLQNAHPGYTGGNYTGFDVNFASYPIDVSFNLFAFLRRSFNASRASSLFSLMYSAPVTMETVEDDDAIDVVRENKGPDRLSEVIFRLIEHPADFR